MPLDWFSPRLVSPLFRTIPRRVLLHGCYLMCSDSFFQCFCLGGVWGSMMDSLFLIWPNICCLLPPRLKWWCVDVIWWLVLVSGHYTGWHVLVAWLEEVTSTSTATHSAEAGSCYSGLYHCCTKAASLLSPAMCPMCPLTFYCSGVTQGHTECFLVVLNRSTLYQKYTPHTHGYGLNKIIHLYHVRYRVEMCNILNLHPNITCYIHHRRLKYNNIVWHRNINIFWNGY
jgi:hypothetical protein